MIHFNCSKILIPVDFSETSLLAIKHGVFIAQLTKADVYLLHVINTNYVSQNMFIPLVNLDQSEIENKATEKLLELAEDIKEEYGLTVQCIVKMGLPSYELGRVASDINASLIVMGTHGYSPLEELVIGSTALKVITKSICPVLTMNSESDHKGYGRIVIPIDTSSNSRQKVNYAIEFAQKFSAVLHAVALLTDDEESEKPAMELILHQIELLAKEKGVTYHSSILSSVKNRASSTLGYVEKVGADLVIIMTDQDAEVSGFFLGPYSQQVIHSSKVPVIAIKPKDLFTGNFTILGGTSGF